MRRRDFLGAVFGTSGIFLSGCSDSSTPEPKETQTASSSPSSTNYPGEVTIHIDQKNITFPPIWSNQTKEDFKTQLKANASDRDGISSIQVTLNGNIINKQKEAKINRTLFPENLTFGENEVQVSAKDEMGDETSDSSIVKKEEPVAYRIDVIPKMNEELREEANDAEGADYLIKHTTLEGNDGMVTNDPVFEYDSPDWIEYDNLPVDLAALEYWHDNDYNYAKKEEANPSWADNQAAIVQETFDQNLHLGMYVWAHGTDDFIIWDQRAKALRIPYYGMFKVTNLPVMYITEKLLDIQEIRTHKDENSYPTDSNGKEIDYMRNTWHPIRFGLTEEEAENSGFDWTPYSPPDEETFTKKKREAESLILGMASSQWASVRGKEDIGLHQVAFTTEYVKSFTKRLRNYHREEFEFRELLNQSKVLGKLNNLEDVFVAYGTVDNPKFAKIPGTSNDTHLAKKIESDRRGKYDDFDEFLVNDDRYRKLEELAEGLKPITVTVRPEALYQTYQNHKYGEDITTSIFDPYITYYEEPERFEGFIDPDNETYKIKTVNVTYRQKGNKATILLKLEEPNGYVYSTSERVMNSYAEMLIEYSNKSINKAG